MTVVLVLLLVLAAGSRWSTGSGVVRDDRQLRLDRQAGHDGRAARRRRRPGATVSTTGCGGGSSPVSCCRSPATCSCMLERTMVRRRSRLVPPRPRGLHRRHAQVGTASRSAVRRLVVAAAVRSAYIVGRADRVAAPPIEIRRCASRSPPTLVTISAMVGGGDRHRRAVARSPRLRSSTAPTACSGWNRFVGGPALDAARPVMVSYHLAQAGFVAFLVTR